MWHAPAAMQTKPRGEKRLQYVAQLSVAVDRAWTRGLLASAVQLRAARFAAIG